MDGFFDDVNDIVKDAVDCLCETLFECNFRPCVFEDEEGNCCPMKVVFLGHDYTEIPSEEKSIAREEQTMLVQCEWLESKGFKRIPNCSKIYCKSKLCVEVYEVQKEAGRIPTMKHDTYGFCFRIETSRCGSLENEEWPTLTGKAMNSNLQSASRKGSNSRRGSGTFRL